MADLNLDPISGQPNWFSRSNLEKYYETSSDVDSKEMPDWAKGNMRDDWLFNDSDQLPSSDQA